MTSSQHINGLVSVVIPTLSYNAFLHSAIQSVLADGVEDIEIIIVLDGPTPNQLPSWADRFPLRNFSTGSRMGAAAAINVGLSHANGEYIARLDADDISMPGRFQAQIEMFAANPSLVMVGTTAELINEAGDVVGSFYVRPYKDLRAQLLKTNPFVHSSLMIRHSALLAVGAYDESCIRMQDYELILRVARAGELAIISAPLVRYRVHDEQSSKKLSGFFGLMRKISFQRRSLARVLEKSSSAQIFNDLLFAAAQLLRYAGLRQPRYLIGKNSPASSNA